MKRLFILFLILIWNSRLVQGQESITFNEEAAAVENKIVASSGQDAFDIAHGPYLQHVGETGVTLVWTTTREAIAWVELAPDDGTHFYQKERPKYFASQYGLKQVSTLHTVRINNLKPGTRYRYRIFSKEVLNKKEREIRYGDVVATGVFKQDPLAFITNDASKKELSFLMLNDIHERNEVMKTLLDNGNFKDADLIFFNGDMVNSLRSKQQMFASFMDTAVQEFASETPMYYARGNHETRGVFASAFARYFPGPTGKLYYLFRQGPVCFLVLDSGEDKPDSDIEYGGLAAFDNYRTKQAIWLKEAIRSEMFQEAPIKVAVMHIPPFGGWHGEDEINKKFVPILNKAGIDVMLCGHLHRYVRRTPEDGDWNFPVIVNSNNTVLQAEANERELKINIIDREKSTVDSINIKVNK